MFAFNYIFLFSSHSVSEYVWRKECQLKYVEDQIV